MKVMVFGAKAYDKQYFVQENNRFGHELVFQEAHLDASTATLASGFDAVCAFVNDRLDEACLASLAQGGVHAVALRCAGFNNVNLAAAERLGLQVVRVPEYSPHGVAEHAVALILALNRKIPKAYSRVRESNFLLEGLLGFNLNTKTVGVVGTGKIGAVFCSIMRGFGCRVLAYDLYENPSCVQAGVTYVGLETLLAEADIISLHCPLTPQTYHLINDDALTAMKSGVMLINTSRGALIDTVAAIQHLKSGQIGYLGLDVYEEESDLFFEDVSDKILEDDIFARLLTFPNVLITGHQAFFTHEALQNIAQTTLENLAQLDTTGACDNRVTTQVLQVSKA